MIDPPKQKTDDTEIVKAIVKRADLQREYDQLKTAIRQVERGDYGPLDVNEIKCRGRDRHKT
jgi:hypothetical protein